MNAIVQLETLHRAFPRARELAVDRELLVNYVCAQTGVIGLTTSSPMAWGRVEDLGPLRVTHTIWRYHDVPLVLVERASLSC